MAISWFFQLTHHSELIVRMSGCSLATASMIGRCRLTVAGANWRSRAIRSKMMTGSRAHCGIPGRSALTGSPAVGRTAPIRSRAGVEMGAAKGDNPIGASTLPPWRRSSKCPSHTPLSSACRRRAAAGLQADLDFAATKDSPQILGDRFSEVDDTRFAAPDRPARGETHCTILLYQFSGRKGPEILGILRFQWLGRRGGGERGIRTPDRVAPMPHFECGAFNHSAISPRDRLGHPGGCRLVDTAGLMT